MITTEAQQHEIALLITNALREDVGDGDHSSLACVPETAVGKAQFWSKKRASLLVWLLRNRSLLMLMLNCKLMCISQTALL